VDFNLGPVGLFERRPEQRHFFFRVRFRSGRPQTIIGTTDWRLEKSHFAQAATNFVSVQSKSGSLSTQQVDALTKAIEQIGQEAFKAANKGDADATEAVKLFRATGRRSATGK